MKKGGQIYYLAIDLLLAGIFYIFLFIARNNICELKEEDIQWWHRLYVYIPILIAVVFMGKLRHLILLLMNKYLGLKIPLEPKDFSNYGHVIIIIILVLCSLFLAYSNCSTGVTHIFNQVFGFK